MTHGLVANALVGGAAPAPEPWVRNPEWLAMPAITDGEQKYAMLLAVWEWSSNFFQIVPLGTPYTVDWGDGSALQNVGNGVAVTHTFAWADADPVTLTSDGYRQCLVVVTPQGDGIFASMDLTRRPTPPGSVTDYTTGLLDLEFSAPYATPPVTGANGSSHQMNVKLEHVKAHSSMVPGAPLHGYNHSLVCVEGYDGYKPISLQSVFHSCYKLRELPKFDLDLCWNLSTAFTQCRSITTVPEYDYRHVAYTTNTFNGCYSLRTIGNVNTSSCTTFTGMFAECRNLHTIGGFDTRSAVLASQILSFATAMSDIPFMDTSRMVEINTAFNGIPMTSIPESMDFSNVVSAPMAFTNCNSLTRLDHEFPKLVNGQSTFNGCYAIASLPDSFPCLVNGASMFQDQASLPEIVLDVPRLVIATSMFGRSGIQAQPVLRIVLTGTSHVVTMSGLAASSWLDEFTMDDASNVVTVGTTTLGSTMPFLSSILLPGLRVGFTIPVTNNVGRLTGAALDAFYTSLGTAHGAQTIVVTNQRGVDADTPSIATSKGWTVTGS